MINNVVLVGRLTKAPDLQYTPSNIATLSNSLAVNRNFKNQDGEREADFINIVAWRNTAEVIANYCGKGSLIGVTGRIQTRNYENQQGQRVYVTEVVAEQVTLLESRNSQQGGQQQNQGNFGNQGGNFQNGNNQGYQSPFDNQYQTPNFGKDAQQGSFFQGQTTNPMDISDDDLPF